MAGSTHERVGAEQLAAALSSAGEGDYPDEIAREILGEAHQEPQEDPFTKLLKGREAVNPIHFIAEFNVRTGFAERDKGLRLPLKIINKMMTLIRHLPDGGVETYSDKLQREEKKGHKEAASYGISTINGKEHMVYEMHWDYFAGSMGIVAAEKFKRAAREATKRHIPLVGIYASSGVRQHENFAGLLGMDSMVYEIERYKQRTRLPYVSLLVGEVWGGISASAVPQADLIMAVAGTNFGFTGHRIIKGYSKQEVPEGAQSAEAHARYRNVDVVVPDLEEAVTLIEGFCTALSGVKKSKKTPIELDQLSPVHYVSQEDRFRSDKKGFATLYQRGTVGRQRGVVFEKKDPTKDPTKETLEEQVFKLYKDSKRPDMEFLLRSCFDEVIPLYSRCVLSDNLIEYPAIIAGIGRIGRQWFLTIGNQPSHKKYSEQVVLKIPSMPSPWDYRYLQRMVDLGKRYGLPLVLLTDTPGAKPTLDAEIAGQSQEISNAIRDINSYPYPVISIVTGMLGSGGGLATTSSIDHLAMLRRALAFVAAPEAITSILYKKAEPDAQELSATTRTIGPTAQRQIELGLIDSIIEEPSDGAETNPWETAELIRNHIAIIFNQLLHFSSRKLEKRRDTRKNRLFRKISLEKV